jgi:hypothetical protein
MRMPSPADSGLHFGQTSSQTFRFTGREQRFTVPTGVTKITVTANGARGNEGVGDGASGAEYDLPGGLGGRVTATITVRPGENLTIFVGGSGRHRGFNGGGTGQLRFGHGGGASDVWQGGDTLGHRVIVAGGGGGGGAVGYCESTSCGYGMGGDGGMGGGREGGGGAKGRGYLHGAGGGGGGGREGSSSGSGYDSAGGGGGGGSSFAEKSATNVQMLQGVRKDDGLIVISW